MLGHRESITTPGSNLTTTMYKFIVFAAALACANAGLIGAPLATTYAAGPIAYGAVGSQSQSVLRSWDGSSAISQYSKAVDTPFSSVRKSDTRITNDARLLAAAPLAYAAAPGIAHAPVAYASAPLAAPIARAGLLGVAYSAAPAVAHMSYTNSLGLQYAW